MSLSLVCAWSVVWEDAWGEATEDLDDRPVLGVCLGGSVCWPSHEAVCVVVVVEEEENKRESE
ncbi:hypothetical protein E2C01_022036 [Portunus trituberculatus]|uniref:Secreted protein n=1 Tax=Portunus trituberculatus TaxID=210409 RepID=A0A5B7E674_PORTR|nr:hypothetical protein [Portunus trituberculatus]